MSTRSLSQKSIQICGCPYIQNILWMITYCGCESVSTEEANLFTKFIMPKYTDDICVIGAQLCTNLHLRYTKSFAEALIISHD